MDKSLLKYIVWRFMTNNHAKYKHYCMEWIKNITEEQISYFYDERERLTLRGIYKEQLC